MPDAEPDRTQQPASLNKIPMLLFFRGFLLISVIGSIVAAAHWYIGLRLIRDPGMPPKLWTVVWVAFASIFLSLLGSRVLPRASARAVQWVGFTWIGIFALLLTACGLSDLVFFIAAQVAPRTAAWPQLQAELIIGVVVPAFIWGFITARAAPRIVKVEVPIRGLAKAFDGLRIVQMSDIHIGDTLSGKFLTRIVAQANALKPDIIAVTGDLIDGSVAGLRDEVASLADLRAPKGVYYVTGNHEYYHGAAAWVAEVKRLGLTVLHNEHRVIREGDAELVIAGVPDLEGKNFSESHRPRADLAFAGAPENAPRILLAHQPLFAKAAQGQNVQLMLSGHTHGGQIFPFMFFVRLQQPVIAGFRVLWGVPVYTSRGTGYWGPPLRVGPTSEITELTLRAQPT